MSPRPEMSLHGDTIADGRAPWRCRNDERLLPPLLLLPCLDALLEGPASRIRSSRSQRHLVVDAFGMLILIPGRLQLFRVLLEARPPVEDAGVEPERV